MSARAIGKFPAWAFQNLLKLLLGALKFLLVKQSHGLFVELHLRANEGIHHFDAATLRVRRWQTVLFLGLGSALRGGLGSSGRTAGGLLHFLHRANAS